MKKVIAIVLAAVMLLAMLAACSQPDKGGDVLEQVKKSGKLVVAMEGTWAPWTYHDENDKLVGFDVEVARAIAGKLGVEAEFVEGAWSGLFTGFETGRYDIIANGVDITEERSAKYDFTTPYAYSYTVLIVRGDNDSIKGFEDLKGKKTANSIDSTYMLLAEEYGATVSGVESLEETLNMVLAGRVDATLNAEVSLNDYLREHPDANLKVVCKTAEPTNVAIPIRKGQECKALNEAISKAIEELRAEGKLTEISKKYFNGFDITTK